MTSSQSVSTLAPADGARPPSLSRWLQHNQHKLVLPGLFLVALLIFAFSAPGFFSLDNQLNVSRQSVYLMLVALAQLIVLVGGGIDLSVGTIVALSSISASLTMSGLYQNGEGSAEWAIAMGTGAALLVGAVVGLLNGIGTAVLRIPSFMMTLGMSSVVFGVALYLSGGVPIYGLPQEFGQAFGYGYFLGIPSPVLVVLLAIAAVYVLLEWTRYGRHLYAIGGNPRAATLSGVRTERATIMAFVLSGVLSALSGVLLTARLGTGEASIGTTFPLESIAACVIAGAALTGGVGRTLAVVAGTFLIVMVQNGMNLMQIGAYAQTMVVGALLIFAMAFSKK
ncbi:ABC transporter permease [Pusillimonas caeni]|uniref:ABC transporter permease n=1 Tax=Pusillimonas caeni TaxID=1348472 RepID=UPI000E59F6B9|nr:ABC transporter permease [Pusillimonas caeni]TFL13132.1 ABC transporter permease [Pusillimonas caeni]